MYSLYLYMTRGCTTIVGDLYIMNLPATVTKTMIANNLATVRSITGTLYIVNCQWVVSLQQPLQNVIRLGSAYFSDNPNLVDTRIPGLTELGSNITVINCNRLCRARYTTVGSGPSDADCPNLQLEFSFSLRGSVSVSKLPLLESVVFNALMSIGKNMVCRN